MRPRSVDGEDQVCGVRDAVGCDCDGNGVGAGGRARAAARAAGTASATCAAAGAGATGDAAGENRKQDGELKDFASPRESRGAEAAGRT